MAEGASGGDAGQGATQSRPEPAKAAPQAKQASGGGAAQSMGGAIGGAAAVGQAQELMGAGLGPVQASFEQSLGADLSGVRVHTDAGAASKAAGASADALAIGQDIYGAASALDPSSARGRETLAHEVIHTVQSAQAGTAPAMASSSVSESSDAAEVEAREGAPAVAAGRAFTVRATPSATAMRSAATIETALDDATQSFSDIMTVISREHPNTHGNFLNDAPKATKLVNRLTGDQMIQALGVMKKDWKANHSVFRLNLIRRAGGSTTAANVQEFVRTRPATEIPGVYGDATVMTWLKGQVEGGPLALFRQESSGLSAAAEGSADFMTWLLSDTSAAEVLRVCGATGRASLITTLTGLADGWGWLADLPGAAGLTPAQVTAMTALRDAAPAGSAERTALDAKISEPPAAATPAEAKAQLDALLATATPDALQIISLVGALSMTDKLALGVDLSPVQPHLSGAQLAQLLLILGLDLPASIAALQTAAVTDAGVVQDVMRGAPTADRLRVAGDAALTTWITGLDATNGPPAIFSVQAGEEGQFIGQQPFFDALLARMTGADLLAFLGDPGWMADSARMLDANSAAAVVWLNTLPSIAELGIERRPTMTGDKQHSAATDTEMQLRGLRLATTNGAINTWIDTYFSDRVAPDAHATQSSAQPDEVNYESPRTRLDAAISAGDAAAVLDALGALRGDELTQVKANDANIIGRLSGPLDNDTYYQAMRTLQLEPKWQIYYLVEEEWGGGPARFQGILGGASDQELADVAGWDAVVDELEDEIEGSPVPAFRMTAAVPNWALEKDEFRAWLLDDTEATLLVRLLDPTAAPILDRARDWDWLDRLPDEGMMLTADERARLVALRSKSASVQAVNRISDIVGNTDNTASSSADALTQLQDELDDVFVDETLCLCMATQLDAGGRSTVIGAERDHAVGAFNTDEMLRFVIALEMPLATAIDWLSGAGTPTAEQLQSLLDRASAADLTALFADAAAITLCKDTLSLAPAMAMPNLPLATVTGDENFWIWTLEKIEPYEALRLLTLGNLDAALGHIDTHKTRAWLDTLPKGIGLAPPARGHLDAIFPNITSEDWQKTFFTLRFDCTLSGGWADASGPTGGDLKALYAQLIRLPLEQVANNRFLEIFNRTGSGTGGTYGESNRQVNAGADQTTTKTLYDGEPHAYTEQYFDHTIRHEVGHAVDASLGSRTALCYDMAGWYEYPEGSVEQFVNDQNGFVDDAGGPALTVAQKNQITTALNSYVNTAGARIAGPGRSIFDMLPDTHILKTRPQLKIAKALASTDGQMHYTNPYDDGTMTWSINFYYQRWMKVKSSAANSAPRDYTLFAPAEYFADMYAEFYRNYNGTPATEGALGGNVPGDVKTWLMDNVHTIGYDSHNRRDAGGPRTGVSGGH